MFYLRIYKLIMGKNELYPWSYGPLKPHGNIFKREKKPKFERPFSTVYDF